MKAAIEATMNKEICSYKSFRIFNVPQKHQSLMLSKIFTQWFLHFIRHTKPTNAYPVIVVLDGHYSHTRNMEVINLARENHVDIICLLLHSSHKMQHLYKAFIVHLIDIKNIRCHKECTE